MNSDTPYISPAFPRLQALVFDRTAILLDPSAESRLEARLEPVVRQWRFESLPALVNRLQAGTDDALTEAVVDALTTHETAFFRDYGVFEFLRVMALPRLIEARRGERRLAIWCAACASGQEPYSLAMLLYESFPEVLDWDLTLLASDVSTAMVTRAEEGVYSQLEVNRGLPARYLARHFVECETGYRVDASIRNMVHFERIHLAQVWPEGMSWDMIFLRNVLIYFDRETREAVLARAERAVAPDGLLVVGRGEMALMDTPAFKRLDPESPVYVRTADSNLDS